MPEMGLSGLAGGVRLIPHPYPIHERLGIPRGCGQEPHPGVRLAGAAVVLGIGLTRKISLPSVA